MRNRQAIGSELNGVSITIALNAAQQSVYLTLWILRHPKHYPRSQANPRPKLTLPLPSAGNANR